MGNEPTKTMQNVYRVARKRAANYNDKLNSIEGAAEMLGVSPYTLSDYELGSTKVVPVDKVVLMADLYNAPELKTQYCKFECPIGKMMPVATEVKGIEGIALRLLRQFDLDSIADIRKRFIEIAADGNITEDEKPELQEILDKLNDISEVISETRLLGEKILKG